MTPRRPFNGLLEINASSMDSKSWDPQPDKRHDHLLTFSINEKIRADASCAA
jgi:hypothetical protein